MVVTEIWHLDRSDYHRFNVAWNNSFRRIFGCVGRKCVMLVLLYWVMSFMADQHKILLWKKALICGKRIISFFANINRLQTNYEENSGIYMCIYISMLLR